MSPTRSDRPAGSADTDLTTVAQDYLKVIWTAQEWSHEKVSTKMLAERMGVSASTASESIRKLADQGLVDHEKYGAVTLTDHGRKAAVLMVRRHRLLETYLVNELGYGWDEVHDEAEVLEHAVSDLLLAKIDAKLGHPQRDPHGDPIPGPDGQVPTPRHASYRTAPTAIPAWWPESPIPIRRCCATSTRWAWPSMHGSPSMNDATSPEPSRSPSTAMSRAATKGSWSWETQPRNRFGLYSTEMADLAACECLLCVDYGDRDQYNDSDRDIIGSVTEYGWSALGIGPTSPEESPPFAYTVGLWHTMRLPELAIYGVNDIAMMQRALNAVAKQAQEGRVLQVGETFADVLALPDVDDYRVKLSPIDPSWYDNEFGFGLWFNRTNHVRYLQILWPDGAGCFPGNPELDPHFDDRQPLMWMPRELHPPSRWIRPAD
ncbi:iron dependent repressor, N-terminal DNA binding domain protein [Mycobacteroides abscessus MAB_082312_2258]|nr:iron dependent repressor, N-terminal DNA binding domain protein [Mycobacteroides abscessus MAB_082312_2258]